jgi:hypothetical protein
LPEKNFGKEDLEPKVQRIYDKSKFVGFTKKWFSRPTPPDLQFEERFLQTQFSVSSDNIYEWNIDGLSEQELLNEIVDTVCSDLPNAFWHRKKHILSLPYVKDFSKRKIPTKARPIQMNAELLEFCQKEISDLLAKGIIRKSKSPWSCVAFYVTKNAEIERGVPRLVSTINPSMMCLNGLGILSPIGRTLSAV